MLVLVSYDIHSSSKTGPRRLRQIAKQCLNYGQRVQYSVFECIVDIKEFESMKNKILKIINFEEDSVRFYILGNQYKTKVEHFGTKKSVDMEGTMIL